eukprot:6738218-Alexandrium_andersonii.AAC.1
MTETRTAIATSVDPLKDEMHDLRERVARLETGLTTSEKKRQMALMNSLDMAHRGVSFIFENDVSAVDRVAALEEVVRRVPGTTNYMINHFRTGPRNESRLSKASYARLR